MKLVTNGRLITRDASAQGYYEHGAVAFEGTKIVEVGEEAALRAKYPGAEITSTPPSPAAFPSSATTRRTSTKSLTAHGGPSTAT